MHPDFKKVYKRFVSQYGIKKGKQFYYAWLNKKGYDDTKPFPKGKKKKEKKCMVKGFELKETDKSFHIEGLIATSHVDNLDLQEGIDIPDMIPKETLESFADQVNTRFDARVMGVHHSEGKNFNAEYFGVADVKNNPAKVISLSDGEWGLFVDTELLKNDPMTPEVIEEFQNGTLDSFSITYDTDAFMTADFDWEDDVLVRVIGPETQLYGYTAGSISGDLTSEGMVGRVVNPNAVATSYGFKEFKTLMKKGTKEVKKMVDESKDKKTDKEDKDKADEKAAKASKEKKEVSKEEKEKEKEDVDEEKEIGEEDEKKEFVKWKKEKKVREEKEYVEKASQKIAEGVLKKMEVKEKVLKDKGVNSEGKEVSLEIKEFREITDGKAKNLEIKEQFRRAAAFAEKIGLNWQEVKTTPVESRDYKYFGTNGRMLEYKGLGLTTNQNDDTDYLQSTAELQDVYDPVIYNALNQETLSWNLLAKDDYSKKGNNKVQFTLKTAANTSAAFYTGNAVATGNVTRLKYETAFKKLQVGVSVDGDMVAAARGGPVSDVFAQEVLDSTADMLAVLNKALFAEAGLETAAEVIGFEYVTDSAGNTTMYNLTRSTTNKLSPDSASDTYINQSSTPVSMTNLRAAIKQAVVEGVNKRTLVWITHPTQGNMMRGKFDDSRRMLTSRDTDLGFSTDLFIDGIPVFEDKDCNTDDWWLVDLDSHRIGIWVPPTIERLGKVADSEDAFIKMYLAVYNRRPRAMVQVYGCATS